VCFCVCLCVCVCVCVCARACASARVDAQAPLACAVHLRACFWTGMLPVELTNML
jgi:hypothetical protein